MAGPPQKFVTPLGGEPYVDWTISYYLDQDPAGGQSRDYTGGSYSFDGHTGLDISLPNFAKMDAGVPVLAVADGVVIAVEDGHPDRNVFPTGTPENSITIDHGGGYTTFYTHLRRGSIPVSVGQVVSQGQQIGLVGASGNAHWPHLHFAVFENGVPVETYLDPDAYWLDPLPYSGAEAGLLDAGVTNYDPAADLLERPSDMKAFLQVPGQTVYAWGAFKGLHAGDVLEFLWRQPDGSLRATSTIGPLAKDDPDALLYVWQTLPEVPSLGTWRIEYLHNGAKIGQQEFEVATSGAPEIRVSQNATYVLDGRTTPVGFGGVFAGAMPPSRTFTVHNHGTAPLTLGSIQVPDGYSLVKPPAAGLSPGESDTFIVRLDTIEPGTKAGEISFATNDSDEGLFNFAVEGLVVAPAGPEIVVELAGVSLVDGDPDAVDFGTVSRKEPFPLRVFTVRNVGSQNLTLAGLSVTAGFAIADGLVGVLPPGGADTFSVQMVTAAAGTKVGQIVIANNDADENPFEIFLGGVVTPSLGGPAWQNPEDPLNVDGQPGIAPEDALLIINLLNARAWTGLLSGELPPPTGDFAPPPYYDVDGDNHVTPTDALLVINHLNSVALVAGEGGEELVSKAAAESALRLNAGDWAVLEWLADEATSQSPHRRHLAKLRSVR
jgi:murein DD-endopeptidase MepM/ murein hydrolase activator NlpD